MPPEPTATTAPSIAQVKANMRAVWMSGDFGVIAHTLEKGANDFVESLGIPPGMRVLDVATGTGNLALPLARSGAVVTGVDIAPNLLEQARVRAARENLTIQFDEGDAEVLPYPDGSFDAIVTMFGVMFAPRPALAVAELARVLRPGGTLAMASWTPGGFAGRMFAITAKHLPPPSGIAPPALWGDPATVHQRLDGAFQDIRTATVSILFDMPLNAAGTVDHFRRYFGPTHAAFRRLDPAGQEALAEDLIELWAGANTASTPDQHMLVPNEYLQVFAKRA